MQRKTIIAAVAVVLAVVAGGGAWAAQTHSSTLTPGASESVSSVWVELRNETETTIEVYTGGSYQEQLEDTDTANELENATYQGNWTIEGSGTDAISSWQFDGVVHTFEQNGLTAAGWTGDISHFHISSAKSASGTGAVKLEDTGGTWYRIHHDISNNSYPSMSYRLYPAQFSAESAIDQQLQLRSPDGTRLTQVGVSSSGYVVAQYGGTQYNIAPISTGQWYEIRITNINYTAGTYHVAVYQNGSLQGEADAELKNSGSKVGQVTIASRDAVGYMDNIAVSSSDKSDTPPTYTSPQKTATNASEMTASVPSISGANVTLKAQGYTDSGSWVTVSSESLSTPGTVTTDVSGLDYSRWRWKATVSPSGSSPSAEIGYTGVRNVSYVPPTLVANKTVTPVGSSSVTSVDIPSAYADADAYTVEVTGQQPSSVGYSTTQTGGAVAADGGATQTDGVSLTLVGTVLGLVIGGVILHGRR